MQLIIRSKRYLIALMVCSAALILFSQSVHAGRYPDCGDVDRGLVKDVSAVARRVDHYIDATKLLEYFCTSAQSLKKLDKELPREVRKSREYKKERRELVKTAERDLEMLESRLTVLKAWSSYDPHDVSDRVVRKSRMKKAKEKAFSSMVAIKKRTLEIQKFIKSYTEPEEEESVKEDADACAKQEKDSQEDKTAQEE